MFGVHGFAPDVPPAVRRRVTLVLLVAVLGVSSSGVLVRGMEADPVAIAAWRTLGAGLLLSPGILAEYRTISRRDLAWTAVAGGLLAAHFWVWFASLERTTVLRSTVLVCLVPMWSALLEWWLHRQLPTLRFWAGLALALPGVALMSVGETLDAGSLAGDALAALGGLLWALYIEIGRGVRQRVGVAAYMGLVCLAATTPLWPAAWLLGAPLTGYPGATWALLAGAVLGPQLLGHQGSNYAVQWLPSSVIAAVMLLEPVFAAGLAAVILGEVPSAFAALGGVLVLAGVLVSTTRGQPG